MRKRLSQRAHHWSQLGCCVITGFHCVTTRSRLDASKVIVSTIISRMMLKLENIFLAAVMTEPVVSYWKE